MSNEDRFNDVLHAIEVIDQVAADGRASFLASEVFQSAVYYNLIIIGEALNAVSSDVKAAHPEWRPFIDYRNFMAHGYRSVRASRAWDYLRHLPQLKTQLTQMLQSGS